MCFAIGVAEPSGTPWAGRKVTEGAEIHRLMGCTGQVLEQGFTSQQNKVTPYEAIQNK